MEVRTYPEMNEKIVGILRISDDPLSLYAAQLIEELMASKKTGRWRVYEGMLTCECCGAQFYKEIMEYCGDNVPRFCPDCGADMRYKKTDEELTEEAWEDAMGEEIMRQGMEEYFDDNGDPLRDQYGNPW